MYSLRSILESKAASKLHPHAIGVGLSFPPPLSLLDSCRPLCCSLERDTLLHYNHPSFFVYYCIFDSAGAFGGGFASQQIGKTKIAERTLAP